MRGVIENQQPHRKYHHQERKASLIIETEEHRKESPSQSGKYEKNEKMSA